MSENEAAFQGDFAGGPSKPSAEDLMSTLSLRAICDRAAAGSVLPDFAHTAGEKKMLAYSRLAPLVRESGLQTFAEFLDVVDKESDQRKRMIASLTTKHTYFNREPHHFEHLVEHVRPDLIARSQGSEKVRIWSAGSSSGEEIHTLMMFLLGTDKHKGMAVAKGNLVVLASDLAAHAVNTAQAATYDAEAVSKLPPALRDAWCEPVSGDPTGRITISKEITRLIRYRQLNLLRAWPFDALFDVIFWRNVMIYFDEPTKAGLVLRFAKQLKVGGYLYIGHSERVSGEASKYLKPMGATIYQRIEG
jgi:chemotaxis protein methyltransferase CheR